MHDVPRQLYSIAIERTFQTNAMKVWQSLTEPSAIDSWFSAKSSFEAKVGGRFLDEDGDNWLVTAIVTGKSIDFTWENGDGYHGSHLRFEISEQNNGTLFRIAQSEMKSRESAQSQLEGWSWAMHTLDSWLRTGKRVTYSQWDAAGKP